MNRFDSLIKKLCPNGVEYREIDSLCKTVNAKVKIKSLDYIKNGKYPIIDQGKNFIGGYTNENEIFPLDEYVIFGDHTCIVKYVDFAFAQGADGVKVLLADKDIIIPKYLFHCMSNIHMESDYSRHWSKMKKKLIPVPPLEIQNEIVFILDNLCKIKELTDKLSDLQQKQYEYYRNKLLDFKEINND